MPNCTVTAPSFDLKVLDTPQQNKYMCVHGN